MKKYFSFALLSAIALTGTVSFTACSSDEPMAVEETKAEDNPTYDPVAKTVTAQFVLNLSSADMSQNGRRSSSTTVQRNGNFRGMKDAKLIGLSTGNSSWMAPFGGSSTGYAVSKTYDLGTLYGATAVTNTSDNNATSSSRRILSLTLPLQTDAMLVYARAIPSGSDEENGKVNITMNAAPENITFDLVSRLGDRETSYNETCNLAALIINRILKTQIDEVAAGNYTHAGITNAGVLSEISWRGLGKSLKDGSPLLPLQENLATLYNTITTMGVGEVRGGSASAVCSMIFNINQKITTILGEIPTSEGDLNAQRLAEAIKKRIENYFDVQATEAATEFRNIGTASTANTIINGLVTEAGVMTIEQYNANFSHVAHGDLMGLPTTFKLPVGAAQLFFTEFNADASTGGFAYKDPSTSLLDLSATIDATHYMYPSELLYFDNSSLYVSNVEKAASDYPNGYSSWDSYSWGTNSWTNGGVVSTTRSVAVKNNINYGVAMLQTKVALKGGVTEFKDNRSAIITTELDQTLTVAEVSAMQLTGIIIGGQNCQLGWNYLPKANGTDDANWKYAIYDDQIPNGTIPTGAGNENYTLVFDNYRSGTQNDQTDVLVALEFQNNSGRDFYGKGNLVRQGGKFYLVGKLTLGSNRIGTAVGASSETTAWPANYPIPPYTDAGASQQITRVFIQDYMTTATFTLGADALKNAFVTVPDLRSAQTSLGLSVDLNWREGLNFNVAIE